MTAKRNGSKPAEDTASRVDKLPPGGGMPAAAVAFLERRTEAFVRATSGPGKPHVYGAGKLPGGS